jgi:hypothetical protein
MLGASMGAELFAAFLIAGLLLSSTDSGRAAGKAFWKSATSPPKKAGGKGGKKASTRKASARGRRKLGKRTGAKVGGWAGRQTRTGTAALGRAGGKGAAALGRASKRAGVKVGDKAQARQSFRRPALDPPVWWISRANRERRAAAEAAVEAEPEPTPPPGRTRQFMKELRERAVRRAEADRKFFDFDSPLEPPPTEPPPTEPTTTSKEKGTTVSAAEIEAPQTDGQFIEGCQQVAQQMKGLAEAVEEHAGTLVSMHLPQSVTGEIQAAAQSISEAAAHIVKAAQTFEAHFEDARDVAQRGMKFTGEEAA